MFSLIILIAIGLCCGRFLADRKAVNLSEWAWLCSTERVQQWLRHKKGHKFYKMLLYVLGL